MYKAGPGDSMKLVKGAKVLKAGTKHPVKAAHQVKGVTINPHVVTGEKLPKIHQRKK